MMFLVCTLGLMTSLVAAQEYAFDDLPTVTFDCQRPRIDGEWCFNNSTCSEEGGDCECGDPSLYGGYHCGISEDMFVDECDPPCMYEGRCYIPEGESDPQCFCHKPFWGDRCQYKRVEHKCHHDGVDVSIAPFGDFHGYMYVTNHDDDDACYLQSGSEGDYTLSISYEECGGPANETDDNGDTLLSYSVLVQYDDLLIGDLDEEFLFVCKVLQSGGSIEFEEDPLHFDRDGAIRKETVEEEFLPIEIVLTDEGGQPIDGPVTLGDNLMLTFTLVGGNLYDSFLIEEIIVTNGFDDAKRRELPFVLDSCVTDQAFYEKKVVTDFSGDQQTTVSLSFKAFKMQFSKELKFENKIKFCNGDGCNATDCADAMAPFLGLGRKKRDVSSLEDQPEVSHGEEDSGKVETFWTRLEVRYPAGWHVENESELFPGSRFVCSDNAHARDDASLKNCFLQSSVLVIVSVLVLLCLVMFAILIAICARSRTGRNASPTTELKSYDNKSYAA